MSFRNAFRSPVMTTIELLGEAIASSSDDLDDMFAMPRSSSSIWKSSQPTCQVRSLAGLLCCPRTMEQEQNKSIMKKQAVGTLDFQPIDPA